MRVCRALALGEFEDEGDDEEEEEMEVGGEVCLCFFPLVLTLKGTGTRDLIWLKVLSLDRSWLVGLTDDL